MHPERPLLGLYARFPGQEVKTGAIFAGTFEFALLLLVTVLRTQFNTSVSEELGGLDRTGAPDVGAFRLSEPNRKFRFPAK